MYPGSIPFELVGALVKWLIQFPVCWIRKTKPKDFRQIWQGPEGNNTPKGFVYALSNILIGLVVIFGIVYFIFWIGWDVYFPREHRRYR